jgi:hypothetical protein
MHKLKNSLIALGGLAALAVTMTLVMPLIGLGSSAPSAPTSQTQNVNVVNTPTVSAQQSGTWNVGINGTPTVNVSPFQTVLGYDETRTALSFGNTTFPSLDVSQFKEIRVITTLIGGTPDYSLAPRLVNPQNPVDVLIVLDDINAQQIGRGTKTYEIPGQMINFVMMAGVSDTTVRVQVYGRSN